MDYTLLTAVHPRITERTKMNARQEQTYYDRAAAHLRLPEKLLAATYGAWRLATTLVALVKASAKGVGHGMMTRNALH